MFSKIPRVFVNVRFSPRLICLICALYSGFLLETEAAGSSTVTSDPLRPWEGEITVWNS